MQAIDVTTEQGAAGLDALVTQIDGQLGYPRSGTNAASAGVFAPSNQTVSLHYTDKEPHPTEAGRYRLVVSGEVLAPVVALIINAAKAAVAAGTPSSDQAAIAALPDLGELDASWTPPL